jgi:hypothetical protein
MNRDEYIAGRHNFWVHFGCGLVVGPALGAWLFSGTFDSDWALIASTAAIAVVVAFSCGYWGDPAWHRIAKIFRGSPGELEGLKSKAKTGKSFSDRVPRPFDFLGYRQKNWLQVTESGALGAESEPMIG